MAIVRTVPLLSAAEISALRPELANPIEYRKSGLSLNHIIGCPLDCAYCVRHLFDNFSMKAPRALMDDEAAVDLLTSHKFFRPHVTPIQLFNRATDPMLEPVIPHLLKTLEAIDRRGLDNHVLVITRWKVTPEICSRLNALKHVKLTVLVTHSGIHGASEPVDSGIALRSLAILFEQSRRYRVILYWRPLIPGVNDSDKHFATAAEAAKCAHAVVFSGLFYRQQIADHYRALGLQEPYHETARRKILPEELEGRIIAAFGAAGVTTPLFRKTSCGVGYVHGLPDYNGHYGIREICDICPSGQQSLCASARRIPSASQVQPLADSLGGIGAVEINDRAIVTNGLDESRRYFIQHSLGYQVHDQTKPHFVRRHGRADLGWQGPHNPISPARE